MSYDVNIGGESFNYTYNVGKLFHDHFPNGNGLRGIDGMLGKYAAQEIAGALHAMDLTRRGLWTDYNVGEPEFCAKYDPSNGWGSTVGALMFLAHILAACAAHPRAKVRVS